MDEREMGRELLRWQSLGQDPGGDPRELTRRVLRRDRRRVRLLAGLTAFFWFLGAAGIFLVILAFLALVAPKLQHIAQEQGLHRGIVEVLGKGMATVAACVASLALAALFTILLVLASRRATLRQVNAHLREIHEELKRLEAPRRAGP
jgi:Na+/proline symporter